ncbi:mannosyltransferase family protein [Dactylosporangium sp. NBC_01737]|uniref:mannosyltransferase family protein n=1 Tax=Dactylosporangium sp. NBC_01737 TaxID=2975959 RepID=UPI002E108934|nr:mannosyltransferase family protein [Dactylosporangium sp. NBC_01737]
MTEVVRRRGTQIMWALPLAVYALSRLLQLAFVWWMADNGEVRSRLLAWDGGHFVRLAEEGYPAGYSYTTEGALTGNGLAFFPGYPMLVRIVHLTTGLEVGTAAITVAWISGAFAAVLICALGTRLYDERVGLALTALFCTQPMSMALSMAYSEALFVAMVAGMFLFAHRGDWLFAGLFGLGAALSRPTGAAAALGLAVAAAMAVHRSRRAAREQDVHEDAHEGGDEGGGEDGEDGGRKPIWQPIAAAALALAGVPGYLLWVGLRVGDLGAWFDIQTAGWGTTFDYGRSTFEFVRNALRTGDGWIQVSVAWMVIGVVVLAAVAVAKKVWVPLQVYGLIALVLVLGQGGYYHSKPRLLVPVLLILVPPAIALGRARPRTAALVLLGCAAFGLWYGSYLITVWHYAI